MLELLSMTPENCVNPELEHRRKVIGYYNVTQRFYELLWHGKALGLHYGLWTGNVSNRKEAILKENEVLANYANIKAGSLVLDAGCGIGGSGIWLAKERNAQVISLNLVNKQLTRGKELVGKKGLSQKVDFVEGDYQKLPFENDAFDVFWSLESIEHATDIDSLIREAFKVVKPGGKIVIAATFLGERKISDEERRQMEVGQAAAGCFNDFRTADAVSKVLKQIGFMCVKNLDVTEWVMKSAEHMAKMCRLGLPVAKRLAAHHLVSPILIANNQWGIYQEGLFKSGATSYNILLAEKPKENLS